jgi:hypothetical protein
MESFKNALQIYSFTNKSNCRECRLPTCMAFAGAVFTGAKKLCDCPYVDAEILHTYGENTSTTIIADNIEKAVSKLKKQIAVTDLAGTAEKIGGSYKDGWLTLKVLGKPYSVANNGEISTDIHIIPWVSLPVYDYILHGGGREVSGRWVPLRELPSGKDWFRLFGQRCEKPLKKIADASPDLFEDMIQLFKGKQVENYYSSDVSVVLNPLPKLPMLICYWYPEEKMESDLHLFFDETAEDYLDINSLNSLGSGFVTMLEKLMLRHSGKG